MLVERQHGNFSSDTGQSPISHISSAATENAYHAFTASRTREIKFRTLEREGE